MTGNGKQTTYKNGDDWGMLYNFLPTWLNQPLRFSQNNLVPFILEVTNCFHLSTIDVSDHDIMIHDHDPMNHDFKNMEVSWNIRVPLNHLNHPFIDGFPV